MKKLFIVIGFLLLPLVILGQTEGSRLIKGKGFAGLSFGANFKNSNNKNVLGLFNILSEDLNGGNIDLNGGYFFGNYFALGGSIIYKRDKAARLIENSDGTLTDLNSVDVSITTGVYVKFFTPLNDKERINLFAKAGISYSDGRRVEESTTTNILTRKYETYDKINFGIIPGVQVIVAEGFAVEAAISIAGLETAWSNLYINGEPVSDNKSTKVNLEINLLSINIGFYYYF